MRACDDLQVDYDVVVYERCIGATVEATERILREGCGPDFPFDAVSKRWSVHYHDHIDHRPVATKAGVEDVLQVLREAGVPMAVATSSRRPSVQTKLQFAELSHYFEHLVCGGETARGKPDPAPYLRAAALLELDPGDCWAVEDSHTGVTSALAAGFEVFQIPDELPAPEVLTGQRVLRSAVELLRHLPGVWA